MLQCLPIPSRSCERSTTRSSFRFTRGRRCPAGLESDWTLAGRSTCCIHFRSGRRSPRIAAEPGDRRSARGQRPAPRPGAVPRSPRRSSMRRLIASLTGVLLLLLPLVAQALPTATPEEVGLSRERLARIAPALSRQIEAKSFPGAVAIVARKGRIAYFEAIGQLDPKSATPMSTVAAQRPVTVYDLLRHTSGMLYGSFTPNAELKERYAKANVAWSGVTPAE